MATAEITQSRRARALLKKQGLVLPRRPEYDPPRLPSDITNIDDEGLMELMVQFQEYESHIAGLLCATEIDEQEIGNVLEVAKSRYLAQAESEADSVTEKKAEALIDPEIQEIARQYQMLKARRKLQGVMVNTMAAAGQVCSRELTRRTSGVSDGHRRGSRYTH